MWKCINGRIGQKGSMKKHFEEILNIPIPDDPVTYMEIISYPIRNEIALTQQSEIRTALRKMKNRKEGGKDEIKAELSKEKQT